ncbi:Acg family FMN-binding oxidoreductase [Ktedonospora formicarum]|uniref:Nitroreductase n=1 Tax=Ktedonospora formicarum TaxID=2778364 RepID=A0A8J3I9F9_9CHLR|nr:hypothetical protein [Ktedonospora formicarum]GHO48213.1 hypothetical protein KSX_63760 [Ktedonospora formicarum]
MEEIHGLHPLDADLGAFPRGASIAEQLRFLVRYAVLAPSEHNTQPWRFRVTRQSLEIHLDPSRALPAIDPDQRALWISCGAACFNLRLAMHYFGMQELLEVLPEPDHPTLAARLTVMLTECETAWEEKQLFRAIPQRRSNRQQFTNKEIPLNLVASLISAAGNEGAWLSVVRKKEKRREIANLIMEAEGRLWASDSFRMELNRWTRAHYAGERDGLPAHTSPKRIECEPHVPTSHPGRMKRRIWCLARLSSR